MHCFLNSRAKRSFYKNSSRTSFVRDGVEHRNTIDATAFAHSQTSSISLFRRRQLSAMSLQRFDTVILRQDLHLADGDGVEFCQPLGL